MLFLLPPWHVKSGWFNLYIMKNKLFILFLLLTIQLPAQQIKNPFFALHNIIRGDSTYDTFDKQVELVKNAGFDGIEINQVANFKGMKAALDKHQFAGAYFYVRVTLEAPHFEPDLAQCIAQLKGSSTVIAPFIISESKRFKPSSHDADTTAVRLMQQVADWAKNAGLQVAIYPHYSFYVEQHDHALDIAKQAKRKNLGLTFNLCHWLATTPAAERGELKPQLKAMRPYLKMATICGANDVVTREKTIWDDYILPLGSGSFDTYSLVQYLVQDLKFKGPIGVQCYNIKANKPQLVQNTMTVWTQYKSRLTNKAR